VVWSRLGIPLRYGGVVLHGWLPALGIGLFSGKSSAAVN
jgi:hypothetical protein